MQPAGGRDQDDPAVARRAHHRHRGPGQPDAAVQVDLEHLAELRGGLLVEHAARPDRRVGHADVQPSPALQRRRDDRLPAGRVGRVGVVGHRLAAGRRDLFGHMVGRPAPVRVRHPVPVVDHDLRTLPGQRQAERAPEPPPAAGDDRHPPGQRRVTHDPSQPDWPERAGFIVTCTCTASSDAKPMDGRRCSVYCSGHDRGRTLVVPRRRLAGVLAGRHHQEAVRHHARRGSR